MLSFLSVVTIPSAQDIIATTTAYSAPVFNDLIGPILALTGILVAGIFVGGLIQIIPDAVSRMFSHKDDI